MSKPVTPASSMVGNSGNSALRLRRVDANGRRVLAWMCDRLVVKSLNIIDTRPARTSVIAGGALL